MSVSTASATSVDTTTATLQGILADEMAEQTAFVWDYVSHTVSTARTDLGGTSAPSGGASAADTIWISPITASTTSHINEFLIYVTRSGNVKIAVYDASGNLLSKRTDPYYCSASGAYYIALDGPINWTSGTTYWLALITDQAMARNDGAVVYSRRSKAQEYDNYEWEESLTGTALQLCRQSIKAYINTYPAPSATDYANDDTEDVGEYLEGGYDKDLTSLNPEWDVYYRFAAVVNHLWSYGEEFSLNPSPAQILDATDVALTTAQLNGRLTEAATDYGFGWDTQSRFGVWKLGSTEWSADGVGANYVSFIKHESDFTGVVRQLEVYGKAVGTTPRIKLAIYADYMAGTATAGTGTVQDDDFELDASAYTLYYGFYADDVGKTIENTTAGERFGLSTTIKHYISATKVYVDDDYFVSGDTFKLIDRGEPGTRLAKQDTAQVLAIGLNYFNLEGTLEVTSGEKYWLAFFCSTGTTVGRGSGTGVGTSRTGFLTYSDAFAWPAQYGTAFTQYTYGFSIAAFVPVDPADADYTNSWTVGAGTYDADDYDHDLTSLTKNTAYYFRFAVKVDGRWYWSLEEDFATPNDVITYEPTNIELYEGQLNGEVLSVLGGTVTHRGFVWDELTHANPGTTAPDVQTDYTYTSIAGPGDYGLGTFNHTPALTRYTTYYYRACAKIGGTWVYGDEAWAHTQSIKEVTGANNVDYTFCGMFNVHFTSGSRRWTILGYQDYHPEAEHYGGTGSNPYIVVWDHITQAVVHGPIKVGASPVEGDAHGVCQLAIDPNDKLHVFYGAHASDIQWTRTKLALTETDPFPNGDLDDFETPKDAFVGTYYYPAIDPDGHLWVAYRSGVANQDLRVSIRESTNWDGTWSSASFGSASHISRDQIGTAWPWVNMPLCPNGDMFFSYLLPDYKFYAVKWCATDSRWETISGTAVTLPITVATQASLLVQVDESLIGRVVGTDSSSNYFANSYHGLQRYKSGAWQADVASTGGETATCAYPQLQVVSDSVIDAYYLGLDPYPLVEGSRVYVIRVRSTDGGDTFGSSVRVAAMKTASVIAPAIGFAALVDGGLAGGFSCMELIDDGTTYYNKKGQIWFQPLAPVTTLDATDVEAVTVTLNGRFEILTTATNYGWGYGTTSKTNPGNVAPSASSYASYHEEGVSTYNEGFYAQAVTSLSEESTYYVRFAVKSWGTWSWGEELSFETLGSIVNAPLFFAG